MKDDTLYKIIINYYDGEENFVKAAYDNLLNNCPPLSKLSCDDFIKDAKKMLAFCTIIRNKISLEYLLDRDPQFWLKSITHGLETGEINPSSHYFDEIVDVLEQTDSLELSNVRKSLENVKHLIKIECDDNSRKKGEIAECVIFNIESAINTMKSLIESA